MSVVIENLTKEYGSQKAVNNISFAAKKGEVLGFLGPNGAGKSTTMKMIAGYLQPSNGSIKVCDIDVATDALSIKTKVGYLPEANPLYFDMYVREYLQFVCNVHGISDSATVIEETIKTVGLQVEANKKIGQLSKGYKQRVGIAAAILHNPEVLILDEPTSGLDPNQIIEIREVIKSLGKTKTVILSSHIMQEVEAVCDRVIIINKGNIVANDSIANLQKQGSDKHSLQVSFDGPLADSALAPIGKYAQIKNLGQNQFEIITTEVDVVKKQLMQLALQNNLIIQSLQSSSVKSLEEVFRAMTQ